MNFTEAIVSKLGTKPEPFGWADVLTLLLVLLGLAALGAIEFLIAQIVRRIAASAWRRISSEFDRANGKDRNGD